MNFRFVVTTCFGRRFRPSSVGIRVQRWSGSFIEKTFAELHHLAEHAPPNVNRRWKSAYRRFMKRYTPPYCLVKRGLKKEHF